MLPNITVTTGSQQLEDVPVEQPFRMRFQVVYVIVFARPWQRCRQVMRDVAAHLWIQLDARCTNELVRRLDPPHATPILGQSPVIVITGMGWRTLIVRDNQIISSCAVVLAPEIHALS
jgi:hypothetical protein